MRQGNFFMPWLFWEDQLQTAENQLCVNPYIKYSNRTIFKKAKFLDSFNDLCVSQGGDCYVSGNNKVRRIALAAY